MLPFTPLQLWLRIQSLIWLPAAAVFGGLASVQRAVPLAVVAVGFVASYAWLVVMLRVWRTVADVVTVARCCGLLGVLWFARDGAHQPSWLTFAVLLVVAAADLIDGALARRFGATPGGAVLDMETDQFVVFGLSLLFVARGGGVHALVLPALRYAFVLAAWLLRVPAHDPKPVRGDNRRGRLICAFVVIALLATLAPVTPLVAGNTLTAAAVLALAWSFSSDARFLLGELRRRGAAQGS